MDLPTAILAMVYLCAASIVGTYFAMTTYQEEIQDGKDKFEASFGSIVLGVVLGLCWPVFPFIGLWRVYERWEDKKYRYRPPKN